MRALRLIGAVTLIGTAFAVGRFYALVSHDPAKPPERKVLFWVDPMHPTYKSDKPGIAPDCGMKLEPVYEDSTSATPAAAPQPAGTIQISPEKQQMIGVKFGT